LLGVIQENKGVVLSHNVKCSVKARNRKYYGSKESEIQLCRQPHFSQNYSRKQEFIVGVLHARTFCMNKLFYLIFVLILFMCVCDFSLEKFNKECMVRKFLLSLYLSLSSLGSYYGFCHMMLCIAQSMLWCSACLSVLSHSCIV